MGAVASLRFYGRREDVKACSSKPGDADRAAERLFRVENFPSLSDGYGSRAGQ